MERLDFLAAREQDVEPVFSLYEKLVAWMDETGVTQWKRTDYLHACPIAYYRRQQALGNLQVLRAGRRACRELLLSTKSIATLFISRANAPYDEDHRGRLLFWKSQA